ncbi:alpha/beta fold hydrolase [Paenibacillus agilis]|uniref:Alpha/beta hydrolase n=1 Tax=Paenibacillus agilis TaxID=3020863 RepID=A0A559IQ57_9BACL|nr:alpha/beta hydrolase [Paenibacillus agilis]TVX89779.1 alpha/beta hydrolase [Paenibacillus agilis]
MIEKLITLENSIRLNVRYSTDSYKPVILFLHFSGGTLNMWDGVLPLFSKSYRTVTPDLRGHGKSDKPETGYHIEDMANDVYLMLLALKIDVCHVVGSSMGAEVGLCLAASHPDKVASLICEGALYNEFGQFGLFYGSEEEIEQEKSKLRTQILERKLPKAHSREAYMNQEKVAFVQQGVWNEHVVTFLESTMLESEDGTITSHYQNFVRSEYIQNYWDIAFESYYARIQCPILFLPSEEEWNNEKIRHSLRAFSSLVSKFEIKLIPGSIHAYVWMHQPKEAGETAKAFIDHANNESE